MDIGEKIKQLRTMKNLTQEELANRAELSKGFISQVERDLTSPSIATLTDILECLGTDLKEFFSDEIDDKIVFSTEDFYIGENEEFNHTIHWIIPNAQKNIMEPILIEIGIRGQSDIYNAHEGEVFGYILSGKINLIIGSQKFEANEEESFYYKAKSSYYIENIGNKEAIILLVSTPPSF